MDKKKLGGALCLFAAAVVWGFGFVAQDMGAAHVQGFTFQASRTLLAALSLLALWIGRDLDRRKKGTFVPMSRAEKKYLLIGGLVCGTILCAAACLQQLGIENNTGSPGKEAFITALYIVMVPLFLLFFGKKARTHVYLCTAAALFGLWLLCMSGSTLTTFRSSAARSSSPSTSSRWTFSFRMWTDCAFPVCNSSSRVRAPPSLC